MSGTGFAGFNAARELSRLVGKTTEIVVINLTDPFLYLPVMPQVAGGLIEPRYIRISLPAVISAESVPLNVEKPRA